MSQKISIHLALPPHMLKTLPSNIHLYTSISKVVDRFGRGQWSDDLHLFHVSATPGDIYDWIIDDLDNSTLWWMDTSHPTFLTLRETLVTCVQDITDRYDGC